MCTVGLDMHNDMLHIVHCLGEATQSKCRFSVLFLLTFTSYMLIGN